jgi:hypothetical protein
MREQIAIVIAAFGLIACDAPDASLVIEGVVPPMIMVDTMTGAVSCQYDPADAENQIDITIDVANQLTLFLVLKVRNTLAPDTLEIDSDPDQTIAYSEAVSPLRFDYRWECDTIGFGSDLGALYLPQFSVNQPFCLDSRDETGGDFVGFDVIPATGAAIPAGTVGGVEIRPVPAPLGIAIYDMFTLAALAQACCASTDGCAGVENGANAECIRLQTLFNDVGILQNQTEAAQRYRPFSLFDGAMPPSSTYPVTPTYALRIRGVLEGVTSSGDTVTSNEWSQDIGIGRNLAQGTNPCNQ